MLFSGGVSSAAAIQVPLLPAAATILPQTARLERAYLGNGLDRADKGVESAPRL